MDWNGRILRRNTKKGEVSKNFILKCLLNILYIRKRRYIWDCYPLSTCITLLSIEPRNAALSLSSIVQGRSWEVLDLCKGRAEFYHIWPARCSLGCPTNSNIINFHDLQPQSRRGGTLPVCTEQGVWRSIPGWRQIPPRYLLDCVRIYSLLHFMYYL